MRSVIIFVHFLPSFLLPSSTRKTLQPRRASGQAVVTGVIPLYEVPATYPTKRAVWNMTLLYTWYDSVPVNQEYHRSAVGYRYTTDPKYMVMVYGVPVRYTKRM